MSDRKVYITEGIDRQSGRRVTSCSGVTGGVYFYFVVPETGNDVRNKLQQYAERL